MSPSKPSRSSSLSRGGRQARNEGVTQTQSSIPIPRQFIAPPPPATTTPAPQNVPPGVDASFGRPSREGKERGRQAPKAQVDPPREGTNRPNAGQVDPSAPVQPTSRPYGPPPNQPGFSRPSGEFDAEPAGGYPRAPYPGENRGKVPTNEQSFSKSPGAQKKGSQRSGRNDPAGAQPPPQQPSSQVVITDWSNSRPPGNESTDDARRAMGKSRSAARKEKVETVQTNETGREDSSDGAFLARGYQAESGHTDGLTLYAMPESTSQQGTVPRATSRKLLDTGPPYAQGTAGSRDGQKRTPQESWASSSTAVNTPSSLSSLAHPSQPNYATGVVPKRTSDVAPSMQVRTSTSGSQSTAPLMQASRRSGSDTSSRNQDGEWDAVDVHLALPAPVLHRKRSASRSRDQLAVHPQSVQNLSEPSIYPHDICTDERRWCFASMLHNAIS
jgi:hypothetical protein